MKDEDSTSRSLVLWQEPAEVKAGRRRVIFNDRDNVVCYHFLFAFLPSEAHFSAPLKLGRTVWWVVGKDTWIKMMCHIQMETQKGPCGILWDLSPRDVKPQDQSGLDPRVTTWKTTLWEGLPTSTAHWWIRSKTYAWIPELLGSFVIMAKT